MSMDGTAIQQVMQGIKNLRKENEAIHQRTKEDNAKVEAD